MIIQRHVLLVPVGFLLKVLKSGDEGGEVWLDDVTINGQKGDFTYTCAQKD